MCNFAYQENRARRCNERINPPSANEPLRCETDDYDERQPATRHGFHGVGTKRTASDLLGNGDLAVAPDNAWREWRSARR
jgi:hypothetical protein